ncbi:MAG: toxin-antitoxin system YwqK family antitoxin [Flavobacteriales bacterium]|nr:toxin-antitoxin system YwqK family antitoxin [Flavobacteriales bacterium]
MEVVIFKKKWDMSNNRFYIDLYNDSGYSTYALMSEIDGKIEYIMDTGFKNCTGNFVKSVSKWLKVELDVKLCMIMISLTITTLLSFNTLGISIVNESDDSLKIKSISETVDFTGALIRITTYETNPVTSLREEFYANGNPRAIINYRNGRYDGVQVLYWENGLVKDESIWENGIAVGKRTLYYDNGKIDEEYFYKKGKISGLYRNYRRDGTLFFTGQMKKGVRHGKWELYNENGKLYRIEYYKRGAIRDFDLL